MARIRSIKPGFWTDEKLAQFAPLVRLTFLGLISAMADDEGRCKGDIRLVKASVWPLDDDIGVETVRDHLERLATAGRIRWYQSDGAWYIQIVNWQRHQKIDKPRRSELPPPPDVAGTLPESSPNPPRSLDDSSTLDTDTDTDRDKEWSGKGSGAEESRHVAPPAPFVSTLELPKGVVEFLAMFYEPAFTERQRERYRDVLSQLLETVDPRHPGPKIRGGIRVKAHDKPHLEVVCRAVMRDPPIDRDKAVVFVLKRLTDPLPGPTVAEKHKAETDAVVAEEEAYHRAARSAGIRWARDHPDDYAPIAAAVDAEFSGNSPFTNMARESQLTQRCARAAGFPDFGTWRENPDPEAMPG